MSELHHGVLSTYTHKRCRCDECRAVWRDYYREYRRRKAAKPNGRSSRLGSDNESGRAPAGTGPDRGQPPHGGA